MGWICYKYPYPSQRWLDRLASGSDISTIEVHQHVIDDLNNGVGPKEVIAHYPDFKWCIYKNSLYDITDFKHPGGQYLMHRIYGRDVSRFLTGSYHLEEYAELPAYAHSK